MSFVREFEDVDGLKKTSLFTKYLRPDIANGRVFPAVRKGRIDFYYRGGKLFSYNARTGFTTHHKYASALDMTGKDKSYISDQDLGSLKNITSFTESEFAYKRIKENCAAYSRLEADGVSCVYRSFSCAKEKQDKPFVVLDIEVSFEVTPNEADEPSTDKLRKGKQDRIDLLVFDTHEGCLRFYEAKHFSNGDLRAKSERAAVLEQLARYQGHLEEKRDEILSAYKNHVEIIKDLFNLKLDPPRNIDPEPCLLVFGFDEDAEKGRLKKNVEAIQKAGVRVYAVGDIKKINIGSLWNEVR